MEIWKNIKGYEGYYMVSNLGNVKSISRKLGSQGKIVKTNKERMLKLKIEKNKIIRLTVPPYTFIVVHRSAGPSLRRSET